MTTILVVFLFALALALVLTPAAAALGLRFGAVDAPGERKVHTITIPRSLSVMACPPRTGPVFMLGLDEG
jgi:UDP-N-acetylmuramyl pentapeptide phosphotransferase/UDP-N-acetylglucosamine-1-phosphate transferase